MKWSLPLSLSSLSQHFGRKLPCLCRNSRVSGVRLFRSLLHNAGSDVLSGGGTDFACHMASFLRRHNNSPIGLPLAASGFRHIRQLMNSPLTPFLGYESIGLNSVLRARALQHAELVGLLPGKLLGQN